MKTFLLFLLYFIGCNVEASKNLVCYYGSWAVYRPGHGKFDVEEIQPLTSVCTHLIFGFAGLSNANEIVALDAWNELEDNYGRGAFKRFTALKNRNNNLKTIIAIGGWNEGSVKYSKMAANPAYRRTFVNSVVNFLKRHNFDGLDMDWEYPANRGGVPADKENFVLVLKELREEFDKYGYLLTAAVSAGKATIDTAYNVPEISKYLHLINVMAYDFHGAWESFTGHHSPLFPNPSESMDHHILTMDYAVRYWMKLGAPKEKLVLGLPLYGRAFQLTDPNRHEPGSSVMGAGTAGPYTREPGTLGYNEICENQANWQSVYNPYYVAPYAFHYNQWVGYDDPHSIQVKTAYARCLGLGGVMVWSVETDDFHGGCHGEIFPLLNSINRVLNGDPPNCPVLPHPDEVITPEPKPHSSSKSPELPTEASTHSPVATTGKQGECTKEGFHRDPNDCSKFYYCALQGDRYIVTHYQCNAGLVFDEEKEYCEWPDLVPECNKRY